MEFDSPIEPARHIVSYMFGKAFALVLSSLELSRLRIVQTLVLAERKAGSSSSLASAIGSGASSRWTERKKDWNSSNPARYLSMRASLFDFSKIKGRSSSFGTLQSWRSSADVPTTGWAWIPPTWGDEPMGSKMSKVKSSCSAVVLSVAKASIQTQTSACGPNAWLSRIRLAYILLISCARRSGPTKFVIKVPTTPTVSM